MGKGLTATSRESFLLFCGRYQWHFSGITEVTLH